MFSAIWATFVQNSWKKNPNNHTRLSVSYENSPSISNNSWTICFWLYKYAAVHYIKPYIIWKCLFCHFQNQTSTSRSQMFSWRTAVFEEDGSPVSSDWIPSDWYSETVSRSRWIRSVKSDPCVGFALLQHMPSNPSKTNENLSFPSLSLWYSDICHQDEPFLTSDPLTEDSSKPCRTKVTGSRNCWISCTGFTAK